MISSDNYGDSDDEGDGDDDDDDESENNDHSVFDYCFSELPKIHRRGCVAYDSGGVERKMAVVAENILLKRGVNQVSDKGVELSSLQSSQESKNKEVLPSTSSRSVIMSNGPRDVAPGSMGVVHTHLSPGSLVDQSEESSSVDISKLGGPPSPPNPVSATGNPSIDLGAGDTGQMPRVRECLVMHYYTRCNNPFLLTSQDFGFWNT